MKSRIITIVFIALTFFSFGQYEKYINLVTPYLRDSIRSGFFYFKMPNNFQPGYLYSLYKQYAPDYDNDMVLIEHHTDSLAGMSHYDYQQTYKGIPVEGAGCIEHFTKNGVLNYINAKVADSINKNSKPKISGKQAVKQLISKLKYRNRKLKFAWEDGAWEKQRKIDLDSSGATWYPNAKLIWAIDTMKDVNLIIPGKRFTLAYKISITTILPDFEIFEYYVDANNGSILKYHSTSIDASGQDIQADVYSYGPQWLDARWKGGFVQKFELYAGDQTHKIHTKKFVASVPPTPWNGMPETRYHAGYWGNTYLSETSPHFYTTVTWDFFKDYFGRIGMDGSGALTRVEAEWKQSNGVNVYNAQYMNISPSVNLIRFGYSTTNYDYGFEPSVVAHEFTHGITHYLSGLAYEHESGALNESFSDIFGTVVQALMLEQTYTDWIIGNRIPNTNTGERSLKNPNQYGTHWTGQFDNNNNPIYDLGQPDKYNGIYWCSCPGNVDDGGVHINSGVQNHWFYLLSEGSNSPQIQGIGMLKAAQITYWALENSLISSSQYSDSKEATIEAAGVLFGNCSQEQKSTVKAWQAVGMFATLDCSETSGINEWIPSSEIKIYPNPTSSEITIRLPVITDSPILIYNIEGQQVGELTNTSRVIKANLSYLENGIYFLHILCGKQHFVKKIILNK